MSHKIKRRISMTTSIPGAARVHYRSLPGQSKDLVSTMVINHKDLNDENLETMDIWAVEDFSKHLLGETIEICIKAKLVA